MIDILKRFKFRFCLNAIGFWLSYFANHFSVIAIEFILLRGSSYGGKFKDLFETAKIYCSA